MRTLLCGELYDADPEVVGGVGEMVIDDPEWMDYLKDGKDKIRPVGKIDETWIEIADWVDSVRNDRHEPHPQRKVLYEVREDLIKRLVEIEIADKHKKLREEEEAKIQEDIFQKESESAAAALRDTIMAAARLQGGWSERMSTDEVIRDTCQADAIEKCLEAACRVYETVSSTVDTGISLLSPCGTQLKSAQPGTSC